MPVFTPISQERFVDHVMLLAARITAEDWVPSYLIGIGRGGLVPATFLSHACGLPMLSVDYSSKVEEFADGALARLAARTRGGDKLLFVDDINDTGGTISRLRSILAEQGAVAGSINYNAADVEGNLAGYSLTASWGDGASASIESDTYAIAMGPIWNGVTGRNSVLFVPSLTCAHAFTVTVWARTTNGYGRIGHNSASKFITIQK